MKSHWLLSILLKKKCDYAVIEVGIGGEHDKTNVIMPEVSIITTIGLDHEKKLLDLQFRILHVRKAALLRQKDQ